MLQGQGVNVFTYSLTVQLGRPRGLAGVFQFAITGPPGVYGILSPSNLAQWAELGITTNTLGSAVFTDVASSA